MKRIDSIQNNSVKAWKKLHTKKGREKAKQYIVEGFHLVEEAIKNDAPILHLLLSEEIDLPSSFSPGSFELTYISKEVSRELSETETTQGIYAIIEFSYMRVDFTKVSKLLLIDEVQDPGNVGTMIRTADAAGYDAVILGTGTSDLYNSKTIRSTQGSLFHMPILRGDLIEMISELKEQGISIYGTSLQNAKPFNEVKTSNRFALIVGNEGKGVNSNLLSLSDENLYIPIYGKAESLNVGIAAGILMYSL